MSIGRTHILHSALSVAQSGEIRKQPLDGCPLQAQIPFRVVIEHWRIRYERGLLEARSHVKQQSRSHSVRVIHALRVGLDVGAVRRRDGSRQAVAAGADRRICSRSRPVIRQLSLGAERVVELYGRDISRARAAIRQDRIVR